MSRPWAVVALAVALIAGGLLLILPAGRDTTASGPLTLAGAWPSVKIGSLPAAAPDGPAFQPLLLLDATTSVGTAPTPDGTRLRLLAYPAGGSPRVLRTLPLTADPRFEGLTVDGDRLAWAETTTDPQGRGSTALYTADVSEPARPPRLLTTDTGAIAFFNSEHDLVIAEDRVHWVAIGPAEAPQTELRSVALTGGEVRVRTESGSWARSAWPWLVSAVTVQSGEVQLRDLAARKRFTVPAEPTDLVTCSPRWCRVQVLAGDGPSRLDVMRADGSDRRRMAGATETAAIIDVAVLDRFEVLTRVGQAGTAVSNQELLLYDLKARRTILVATGVGTVVSRAGRLWWSTGDIDAIAWHALDLRALT